MLALLSARVFPELNSKVVHLRRYGFGRKRLHRTVFRDALRVQPGQKVLVSRIAGSLFASTRAPMGFWRNQCSQRYICHGGAYPMYLATEHEATTEVEDFSDFQFGGIVRFFDLSVP